MVNVLYTLTWNRTMKPIVIVLGRGKGNEGERWEV
jgi:hypothetical protein